MGTLILALWACGSPSWTAEGAVAPTLARLDTDGDGRVVESEYQARAWRAPPFTAVDLDGDGALSTGELLQLLQEQDPATFVGDKTRRPLDPTRWARPFSSDPAQRQVRELLDYLAAEVHAKDPDLPLPSPDQRSAAVASGDLDSPASLEALSILRSSLAQEAR